MTTTTTTPGRRFFGDAGSLRSFRGKGSSSNPPSLKTTSLKGRRSLTLPLPSLLGFGRGAAAESPNARNGIKNAELNTVSSALHVNEKTLDMPSPFSIPINALHDVENDPRQNELSTQRPRSKSRTILRRLTTKFRSRSPQPPSSPPLPSSRAPAATSNFASKENREAALRARGLLPPLKPNKDLSFQEREQDQRIPVIASTDEAVPTADGDDAANVLTAASLVKREWEAKNRSTASDLTQRERMNTFRFGGLSSPAPSVVDQNLPSTELETVAEVDSPLPSPVIAQSDVQTAPSSPTDQVEASQSAPSFKGDRKATLTLTLAADIANASPPARTQLMANPPNSKPEPHLVPLPPSPSPSRITADRDIFTGTALFIPTTTPLPPSPVATSSIPGSPVSFRSTPTPIISLSPPGTHSASPERCSTEGISGPARSRTLSSPPQPSASECGSSIMTPSLDTSSQTMTISTLNTSESLPISGRDRNNSLKAKIHETHIPAIIESPIEESVVFKDSFLELGFVHEPAAEEILSDDEEQPLPRPQTRPRGLTDSAYSRGTRPDRRKSLNPFKRGQTLDSSDASSQPTNVKRLSMSASLTNMRRSVVGTLTRPKSTLTLGQPNQRTFDASHLPPSPTIPTSFAEQASKSPSLGPSSPTRSRFPLRSATVAEVRPRPRQAVSPTLHSRGSILMETINIEDEESRRMTELAFLG